MDLTVNQLAEIAARGIHERFISERDAGDTSRAPVIDFYDDIPEENRKIIVEGVAHGLQALLDKGYTITPPINVPEISLDLPPTDGNLSLDDLEELKEYQT